MQSNFSGIVFDGSVQLDQRIELADQCRVHVTITPFEECQSRWTQALAALDQLKRTNPIRSAGLRFTRDQLHERN